jgi:hypothetical protein
MENAFTKQNRMPLYRPDTSGRRRRGLYLIRCTVTAPRQLTYVLDLFYSKEGSQILSMLGTA